MKETIKLICKFIPNDDIRFEGDFFKLGNYYDGFYNSSNTIIFYDERHSTYNHFDVEDAKNFFITEKEVRLLKLKKLKKYDKRR